jgi:HEPN domain-containing protein
MGRGNLDLSAKGYFGLAEQDRYVAHHLYEHEKYDKPGNTNYNIAMFHVTQSIEKFMKGYIVANNIDAKQNHNLIMYFGIIANFDVKFRTYKDDISLINKYVDIKYDDMFKIEDHEIKRALKILDAFIQYPPIMKLRDKFKGDKDYVAYEYVENNKNKEMTCVRHQIFEEASIKSKVDTNKTKPLDIIRSSDNKKNIDSLEKLVFICDGGDVIYILERVKAIKYKSITERYQTDAWQFKSNFTKEQALQFEKDWDQLHKNNGYNS